MLIIFIVADWDVEEDEEAAADVDTEILGGGDTFEDFGIGCGGVKTGRLDVVLAEEDCDVDVDAPNDGL